MCVYKYITADTDRDMVTISSDEELMQALEHFKGNLFRLYIKTGGSGSTAASSKPSDRQDVPSQSSNSANSEQGAFFHPGVVCDGCNGPIHGTRFKCMNCSDYDLCSGCERKGIHVNHNMLGITQPVNHNPWIHAFSSGPRGGCGSFYGGGGGRRGGGRRWQSDPFLRGGWGAGWGGRGGGGCPVFPGQGRKCQTERKPKDSHTEANGTGSEPMDTEQKGGPSKEDQRGFLRGVGEAVSNFLEPFGMKVDVDVLGGDGGTTAEPKTGVDRSSAATTTVSQYCNVSCYNNLLSRLHIILVVLLNSLKRRSRLP